MISFYKKGAVRAPEGYTLPSKSFKKHVFLAIAGLGLFIIIYMLLMFWFAFLSYQLFTTTFSGADNPIVTFLIGLLMVFISVFMFKSLFIFKKKQEHDGVLLTQEKEPILFDYLNQLADEIGAPRPHKVFLSSMVNACVFYDLSIANLFFPTKKNLEIGLGLVNVLSLGEFKAILAHEFGHFAQRSMLLGRYVYTAQQIAIRVVNKRDALDKLLAGLSSFDLRIAWIGWIISILIWAMRSLVQTLFSVVAIAERALSKEMEFQADIVAVSLTGSDALIHALYKLKIADQAYNSAVEEINRVLQDKKAVYDMFSLQSHYIEKMKWTLGEPTYGESPKIENSNHRIFNSRTVNPPQMWSTHPSDNEREENAKRNYLYAEIDSSPSWKLFQKAELYRISITAKFIATAKVETEIQTNEQSIASYNKSTFEWQFLHPKYKGVYINRFAFLNYKTIDEAYDTNINTINLKEEVNTLYSQKHAENVKNLKDLNDEIQSLIAVQNEVITAEKRKIVHRGNEITRRDIPEIISSLNKESKLIRDEVIKHDQKCRKVYFTVAEKVNSSLSIYIKSIAKIVHYTEHAISDLNDAYGKYNNVLNIVLADGRVSSSELNEVLNEANKLHRILKNIFELSKEIKVNKVLQKKLDNKMYEDLFEPFKLGSAINENINDWAQVIDGWVSEALTGLSKLRNASLEHLLKCEEELQTYLLENKPVQINNEEVIVVDKYSTLVPGEERSLQHKLGLWDRFHMGDGIFGAGSKFAVSAMMIITALFIGNYVQTSTMYIYNGLGTPVYVNYDKNDYYIEPYSDINFIFSGSKQITTTLINGDTIEAFEPIVKLSAQKYVYNVASAAVMVRQTAVYGSTYGEVPDEILGNERWFVANADFIMEDPPASISTSSNSSGGTRDVIYGFSNLNPYYLISLAGSNYNLDELILNHAIFDDERSGYVLQWLAMAAEKDTTLRFVRERLKHNPNEVISYRALMDYSDSISLINVKKEIEALYSSNKSNGDFHYLHTRMMLSSKEQDDLFIQGYKKWPKNQWLAMASAFILAQRHNWKASYEAFVNSLSENKKFQISYGEDFERVKRYLSNIDNELIPHEELTENNDNIMYYKNLETELFIDFDFQGDRALQLIFNNKIAEALQLAIQNPDIESFIFRVVAASSDPPDDVIKKVLDYEPSDGINANNIWLAIGTAIKYRQDYKTYFDQLSTYVSEFNEDKKQKYKAIFDLIKNQKYKEAEKLILEIDDFRMQIKLYCVGVIADENLVPNEWKVKMNLMMFANEKPLIKSI